MTTGLYLDRLELPRAHVFKREPYIIAITVNGAGAPHGQGEIKLQTEPIRGVKRGKPHDFDPPLELFPPSLHGGVLASRIIVMESDKDFRRAGEVLASVGDRLRGTSLGKRLAQGVAVATGGIAAAGLAEVAPIVIDRLKKAGDDFLGEVSVALDGSPGWIERQSDNGKVRLRLRCAETAEAMVDEWSPDVDVVLPTDGWVGLPHPDADPKEIAELEAYRSPTRWAQIEPGSPCLAVVPGAGGSLYRGEVVATGDAWAEVEFPDWAHDPNVPEKFRVVRLKDIQIPQESEEDGDEMGPEVI